MKDGIYQNSLHPRAMYLDDGAWLNGHLSVRDLPSAQDCKAVGVDRFRLILPETAAPPDGWQLVKKTLLRSVPVQKIGSTPLNNLASFRSIKKGSVDWETWINAHWTAYQHNHIDNPPANLSFMECEQVFGGDDLQPDNGVGLFQTNKLVGLASLRTSEESLSVAQAGWIATWGPNAAELIDGALNWVMVRAKILGFSEVEIEADDNDLCLWQRLQNLPTLRDETFLTWQQMVSKT